MSIPYVPGEPLSCEQIRQLDALAIEQIGVPGVVLMENAGRGIAEFVYGCLVNPAADQVLILCGAGNNGGDGLVVARHLRNAGVPVTVALSVPPEKLKGDAATNADRRAHGHPARTPLRRPADKVRLAAACRDYRGCTAGDRPRGRAAMAELVDCQRGRVRTHAVDIPWAGR